MTRAQRRAMRRHAQAIAQRFGLTRAEARAAVYRSASPAGVAARSRLSGLSASVVEATARKRATEEAAA